MAKKNAENAPADFSIEQTVDMGIGDSQLLQDLMAPETSTSDPDELEDIAKTKEEEEVVEKKTPTKEPVKKEEKEKKEEEEEEEKEEKKENQILDFLQSDESEEEEEEEEEDITKKVSDDSSEEEEEQEEDKSKKEESEGGTQFEALSKDLFKLGVFQEREGDEDSPITTPEDFLDRIKLEQKAGAQDALDNFLGQFGEDYQNAFEAIYVKGVNPKEYFDIYNEIVDFSELDMTKEENQIKVMRQALTDHGLDSEDVSTEIQRIKDYGDLETVSEKHHKVLIKRQALKLQEKTEAADKETKQKAAMKGQYTNNVRQVLQEKLKDKEFDGIPLNGKMANELQDFLLVDKYRTPSGELLTDFDRTILDLKKPSNHAKKVKVAMLLKMLDQDPTLSALQNKAVSKKTDELFSEVARQKKKVTKKSNSKPSQNNISNRWFK